MPEIRSPLTSHIKPGDYGASFDGSAPLALSECPPGTLVQIAGWQDFPEATAPALKALGFDGPGDYRTVQTVGLASCFRIAPDKLLLCHQISETLNASLENLEPARAPVLDLSHARWLIEIRGPAVEALLARLATIDFSLPEFPEGTFAQTGIHHVSVLFHRISVEKFQIYVPITWVGSIWDLLCETATPFGYRVEAGQS